MGLQLFDLYEAYIPNLGLLRSLKPFKKFSVVGGGWVHSEYSVLLWSKALDLRRTKLNNIELGEEGGCRQKRRAYIAIYAKV